MIEDCSSYALSIKEPFGIWGGMTEVDRRELFVASAAR